MPVVVACANCKKKLRAADKLVGKFVKCPHCAQKVKITNKPVGVSVSDATTIKPGKNVESTLTLKAPVQSAKPSTGVGKTSLAKQTPSKKTPPVAAPTPALIKKKPASVDSAVTAKPVPTPPRPEPKREAPRPKPVASHRYDADDDGTNSQRMRKLLAVVGVLSVVGFVVLCYAFFSGPSLANVTGTVQFGVEPLEQAEIVFVGADDPKLRPFKDITGKGGTYKLTGHTGEGVPLGKYKVFVTKLVMPDGTATQGPAFEMAREKGWLRELLPRDYSIQAQTKLSAEVKAGRNTFDFSIPKTE